MEIWRRVPFVLLLAAVWIADASTVKAEPITTTAAIVSIIGLVLSVALTVTQMLLTPKPKKPVQLGQTGQQLVTTPQAINFWRIAYGECRIAGGIIYRGLSAQHQSQFHQVTALVAHEVESIDTIILDDRGVFNSELNGSGEVVGQGWFSGGGSSKLRVQKKLGTADQTAFDDLVADTAGEWTPDHRARGHALVYTRYGWSTGTYPTLPNVTAIGRWKKVRDTRDGVTRYTPNFALCLRDYLLTPRVEGGFGAPAAACDDAEWSAAANICDEFVNSPTTGDAVVSHTAGAVAADRDSVDVDGGVLKFQRGDRCEVTSTGTVPAGIPSPAYAMPLRQMESWLPNAAVLPPATQFASSYANALAGVAVDITDAGTGTITITKTGEPRWTMNGSFSTDQAPRKIVEDMLASCGGRLVDSGGKYRLEGLAWVAPTLSLDEDDLRSTLKVQTRRPRRDRFNALKGTYSSPINNGQPSDYPAVTAAVYEAQDGERIFNELEQLYTSRSGQAQRAAKLTLARSRFERTATYPALLTAYDCRAAQIVAISNTRRAWVNKPFEILDRRPVIVEGDEGSGPYLGIDLSLNEASEEAFEWASTEEQTDPPVIAPTLPDWAHIPAPGTPAISEFLYEGRFGSDVKSVVRMQWAPSPSVMVIAYETEFRPADGTDDDYAAFAIATDFNVTVADHADFEPGTYYFRVRASTGLVKSPWATTAAIEILGLSGEPVALTGLTLQKISGHAILGWNMSPDLDVLRGGWIEFRHSPLETGATEGESTSIGNRIDGRTTQAVLPLKVGTYFVRAVDKLENVGPFVSVSTDGATVLQWANIDSLIEDPTFTGTKTNCAVSGGTLSLSGSGDFDAIVDLDLVLNLDGLGGTSLEGLYEFSAGFDFTTMTPHRLRPHILASVSNELDQIDDRLSDIDDWENFDGTTAPGAADAWVEVRSTNDDPAGAPTWTAWERLDISDFNNRAHQLRTQLRAYDPAYNIVISELRIFAEELV